MTFEDSGQEGVAGAISGNVEDILPLLPLQKALLLHRDSEGGDPGLLQVRCTLQGRLDPKTLRAAWDEVVSWHTALRMSVWPRGSGDPIAIVWKSATAPFEFRGRVDDESMKSFIEEDRRKGIELEDVPPWRVAVSTVAENRHELTWTCHHLLFDGWSSAIVLDEVLAVYGDLLGGRSPRSAPTARLQDFYAARSRDECTMKRWWRDYLTGFEGNYTLPPGTGPGPVEIRSVSVPHDTVEQLRHVVADWSATDNAVIQASLAIALSSLQRSNDLVFGTTVSGRHLNVEGIDRTVGYLANTVPIRVVLEDEQRISDLINGLRTKQFEMQQYEHASLAEIHQWSGLPGFKPLFDTFLVVENFPLLQDAAHDGLTMERFRSDLTTAYPITVVATFDRSWHLRAEFMPERVDDAWVDSLLVRAVASLADFARRPSSTVGDVRSQFSGGQETTFVEAEMQADGAVEYDLPITAMEHQIARVWQQVLGISNIGVHEDYFDLGGTSVLALRLFDQIELETGIRLPLRTILAAPTVAGLASAATRGNPVSDWRSLVPIQNEGEKTPLFCVHSGGGNALTYRDLARALGSERPVYGLTAIGLNGETEPLDSIPEMAELYIEEMKAVQPKGPYALLGHCFGGSVCLEMAHQLEQEGEEVSLIVGIDATLPLPEPSSSMGKARRTFQARGIRGLARAARRRIGRKRRQAADILWDGSVAEPGVVQDHMRQRVHRANQQAFQEFDPPSVHTAKLIVRSGRQDAAEGIYWTFDWDSVGARTEFAHVEASHTEILRDPWVGSVAEIIDARLPG